MSHDLVRLARRRLSAAAIKKLRETAAAEEACGDSDVAVALNLLLDWHEELTTVALDPNVIETGKRGVSE